VNTPIEIEVRTESHGAIQLLGTDVIFTTYPQGAGNYDPSTGKTTGISTPRPAVKGVVSGFDARLVDGDVIRKEDLRMIIDDITIENAGFVPNRADDVYVLGRTWKILSIVQHPIIDQIAAWEFQLR
jgi:hypothetical protein